MAVVSIDEYQKALSALSEAIAFLKNSKDEASFKIARDACIQRFEFSVELAWKVSKKVMGTSSSAPKTVVREMGQDGLVDNVGVWLNFIDGRNKSSHTYDEEIAKEVYQIVEMFEAEGISLLKALKSR